MAESPIDPIPRAAATAYLRIDRDLRSAPQAVRPMLRMIRSKLFRQGFNVKRLCALLEIRSTRETAKFNKAVGTPIARYLEDRRLETSCRLLVGTELPLEDVAARVGYRRYKTWRNAFRRRMGCLPKLYRRTGGLAGKQPNAGRPAAAEAIAETGSPRYLAGIAELAPDAFCARCNDRLEPGLVARVFEDLDPLCNLCALEHAPRELADFLFINAERRQRQSREHLERLTDPERILDGFRRQLSEGDADVLIWALLCRYPASAGVAGEILKRRELERQRLLER